MIDFTSSLQFLGAVLLGIIGWNIRHILQDLDELKHGQQNNTQRLVRIETKLEIGDNNHADLA